MFLDPVCGMGMVTIQGCSELISQSICQKASVFSV